MVPPIFSARRHRPGEHNTAATSRGISSASDIMMHKSSATHNAASTSASTPRALVGVTPIEFITPRATSSHASSAPGRHATTSSRRSSIKARFISMVGNQSSSRVDTHCSISSCLAATRNRAASAGTGKYESGMAIERRNPEPELGESCEVIGCRSNGVNGSL